MQRRTRVPGPPGSPPLSSYNANESKIDAGQVPGQWNSGDVTQVSLDPPNVQRFVEDFNGLSAGERQAILVRCMEAHVAMPQLNV